MSPTATLSMTLVQQPAQTIGPAETYLYHDAYSDALELSVNPFTGQDLRYEDGLFLWESRCRINGTKNCQRACSDSEDAYNSVWASSDAMYTLHNCVLYPILATAAIHGWLVEDPPGLLESFNINASNMLEVRVPNASGDDEEAWPAINRCLHAMCALIYGNRASDICPITGDTIWAEYHVGPIDDLWTPRVRLGVSPCEMGSMIPNADLGGPGVLVSCMQQIAILGALWSALSFVPWLRSATLAWHKRKRPAERQPMIPSGTEKQSSVLVIALQEFQKTQVFFFLILQISALLALNNATLLDAPTWGQLQMNITVITLISATGVYPIAIGLLILRKSKVHLEWFTLLSSLVCACVSSATWYETSHANISPKLLRQTDFNPHECGGINPANHCLAPAGGERFVDMIATDSLSILRQEMSVVPLCVILYLTSERAILKLTCPTLYTIPGWAKNASRITMMLFTEAWLLWGNIDLFYRVYSAFEFGHRVRVWTVGQVISVAIYIPVFIEWLYLALRGIEASFSIRLPENYKVVRTDASHSMADPIHAPSNSHTSSDDQHSNAAQSSYELIPNPPGSNQRVIHAHTWSPA